MLTPRNAQHSEKQEITLETIANHLWTWVNQKQNAENLAQACRTQAMKYRATLTGSKKRYAEAATIIREIQAASSISTFTSALDRGDWDCDGHLLKGAQLFGTSAGCASLNTLLVEGALIASATPHTDLNYSASQVRVMNKIHELNAAKKLQPLCGEIYEHIRSHLNLTSDTGNHSAPPEAHAIKKASRK